MIEINTCTTTFLLNLVNNEVANCFINTYVHTKHHTIVLKYWSLMKNFFLRPPSQHIYLSNLPVPKDHLLMLYMATFGWQEGQYKIAGTTVVPALRE